MSLSSEQKKRYRSIGHNLKPVVTIADKGLADTVLMELERALTDHELIKIKLAITDREARKQLINNVCSQTGAALVQEIGKVALIFRQTKKTNGKRSNLLKR